MDSKLQYDYIIAGAGCAGLSLAMHLIEKVGFNDKKVLIIDQDPKKTNDRTWCFWEKEPNLFEPVVHHQWKQLRVYSDDLSINFPTDPYVYKMIRGIDFYEFCFDRIRRQKNFAVLHKTVDGVFSSDQGTGVLVEGVPVYSNYVFNSIVFERPVLRPKQFWLLQHFKGWTIETVEDVFDPAPATLMDFRTDQDFGTAFCYVLPFSSRRALVEYTVFSKEVLDAETYNNRLRCYIAEVLKIRTYEVMNEEFGVIPMTNFKFERHHNNVVNLGTAGGQTKGSSGYTFNFIQKHSKAIVEELVNSGKPYARPEAGRFSFYDGILLNILHHSTLPGKEIFGRLFKNNTPEKVLKFLDNETSLLEELAIIRTLPTRPFLQAAVRQLL